MPPAAERGATPTRHPGRVRRPLLLPFRPMRWALPLLIVVVFVAAIVASLMPNPKATAEGCPGFCPNLGLDLVGGLRGEYQVIATDNQAVTPDILNQTRDHHRGARQRDRRRRAERPDPGRRPDHGRAAGRRGRRRDPEPRGHHRPPGLRGRAQPVRELHRHGPAAAGGHGRNAHLQRRPDQRRATGDRRRPACSRSTWSSRNAAADLFDDYAKAHYRRAVRDRPRRQGHRVRADHQRDQLQRSRPDQRQLHDPRR